MMPQGKRALLFIQGVFGLNHEVCLAFNAVSQKQVRSSLKYRIPPPLYRGGGVYTGFFADFAKVVYWKSSELTRGS